MKINLTWGESVAVRAQFVAGLPGLFQGIIRNDLMDLNYSPFEGDAKLIEHTHKVIERQVGRKYKHVVLTNGAAGGCVIAMRAYRMMGKKRAWTHKAPYFSLYPSMMEAAGLGHTSHQDAMDTLALIDSPSNPEGLVRPPQSYGTTLMPLPVIWDAVYANRVYSSLHVEIPHEVLVGSYSKLTGLNGIRIGWIATDNDLLHDKIKTLVAAEYCGLSVPSIMVLNQILPNYDWDTFEKYAQNALNYNREEWTKLEKFFGDVEVKQTGMFYYGPMDAACKRLFDRAGIVWSPGSALGHSDDFGRFNLGASLVDIQKSVAQVLKADKLP